MPVVISHASFISEEDADLLRQTNQYISTTPESEAHYGHDNPGAETIQDQASLGIDSHVSVLLGVRGSVPRNRLYLSKALVLCLRGNCLPRPSIIVSLYALTDFLRG